jgi:exosortase
MSAASGGIPRSIGKLDAGNAVLLAAFGCLALPTLASLAQGAWTREFEAFGPVVLIIGLWLLWRQWPDLRRRGEAGAPGITVAIFGLAGAFYVFGRAYDLVTLEALGLLGAAIAILQAKFGLKAMRANGFPFFYLAFVVPPPFAWLANLTGPLKRFVSMVATDGLHAMGLPVGREGVTIFVSRYQLLMEDACAGLNSIVGLIAVGVLYVHLAGRRSTAERALLIAAILPVAIAANILRVMLLVVLTYWFGAGLTQTYMHEAAGLVLFVTALAGLFLIDRLLSLAGGHAPSSA